MKSAYTVDYFIKKFKAIPKKKWTTHALENNKGKMCAFGFCGEYNTTEASELAKLFWQYLKCDVVSINDNLRVLYNDKGIIRSLDCRYSPYKHPKTRILKALECIKLGLKV